MSSDTYKFLTKLATDPEMMSSYILNPRDAMEAEGLSTETQEAMISGDALQIHNLIATDPIQETDSSASVDSTSETETIAADQTGADWQQNYYYQFYLWWLSTNATPTPYSSANDYSQWYTPNVSPHAAPDPPQTTQRDLKNDNE